MTKPPSSSSLAFRIGYYVLGPLLTLIAIAFLAGVVIAFGMILAALRSAG